LYCVENRLRYATSFLGVIDLLSVLPTYIAFFVPEAHALIDVRILRPLPIFRVLKLTLYVAEYSTLVHALRANRRKIMIFISFVLMLDLLLGTLMYVIEGPKHGFTSIPMAMYWAIVTMTMVGYGDLTPQTDAGRLLSSVMMLLGWGILAVPTGIVTSEMTAQRFTRAVPTRTCPACMAEGLEPDANSARNAGRRYRIIATTDFLVAFRQGGRQYAHSWNESGPGSWITT
jgi:voltage-gated potassium channel